MSEESVNLSALWDATCRSDQHSFAKLHYKLYPSLFYYAHGIVQDKLVAEDLVQDLFVKLWVKKEQIGKIENVKAYTFQSIRSICFNYLKKRIRELQYLEEPKIHFQLSIEDSITKGETVAILNLKIEKVLNELPARQREIIYLRFFEKLEYQQIVEITGVKYQSVVNHIHRAIHSMRNNFKNSKPIMIAV